MIKARLFKINSNHNNLRTDEVVGEVVTWPQVNSSMQMYAEPLTQGAVVRSIMTSRIQEITKIDDSSVEFRTMNSKYRLEKL